MSVPGRYLRLLLLACLLLPATGVLAARVDDAVTLRAALAAGLPQDVMVVLEHEAVQRWAAGERRRRALSVDDQAVLDGKASRFRSLGDQVLAGVSGADLAVRHRYARLPLLHLRLSTLAALERLAAHPGVRAVRRDGTLRPVLDSTSATLAGVPAATGLGFTGAGATVVFADTGVNYTLPDFGSCTAPGVPAGCRVSFYANIADGSTSLDANGHGTNVAGVVAGVAPGARIRMYNVFGSHNSTTDSLVIYAMDQAIAARAAGIAVAAISLSLGDSSANTTTCPGSSYDTAVQQALAAGIVTVVAAGNNARSTALSNPACVPGVVSVGAVYSANWGPQSWAVPCTDASTAADQVACFSNSASYLTVLAPGAIITAAGVTESGTSQATPFVSGAVAVLAAEAPGSTPAALVARITSTGVPVTDPRNHLSFPRLNLGQAVRPVNDLFADRTSLGGASGSVSASNVDATRESGEPLVGGSPGGASLWWQWVAPASGQVSVDTQGSSVATLLGVYSGSTLGTLSPVAASTGNGSAGSAAVLFQAVAGQAYPITVDGVGGATGTLALAWSLNTTAAADVSVTLTPASGIIGQGTAFGFTAQVANAGPQAATGVTLQLSLPAGQLSGALPAGCQVAGTAVSCSLGTLAAGASSPVALQWLSGLAGALAVSASVSSSLPDPVPANNTAAATFTSLTGGADAADAPALPAWAAGVLALALLAALRRRA